MSILITLLTIATATPANHTQGFEWRVEVSSERKKLSVTRLKQGEVMMSFKVGRHKCQIKRGAFSRGSTIKQQQTKIQCQLANGGNFELTSNTCRVLNLNRGDTTDALALARQNAFNLYRKLGDEDSFALSHAGKNYKVRVNCEPESDRKFASARHVLASRHTH
jgi:hypothetical protein